MSDSAKDGASGIRAIPNPAAVLRRREEAAGLGMDVPESEKKPAPAAAASAPKQGGPGAKDEPKPKPKPRRSLMDILRGRKAEEVAMADEYEGEWRKDTDDPLTDAVRAGRAKLAERGASEREGYESAFRSKAA